jgi:hypothetical protein
MTRHDDMTSELAGPFVGFSFAGGCLRDLCVYGVCTLLRSEPVRCPLDAYGRSVLDGCE